MLRPPFRQLTSIDDDQYDIAFEHNLRAQLEAEPKLRRKAARILAILNARPSKRRTRQITRWEAHAAAELQLNDEIPVGSRIDWSSVDWMKWLGIIVSVILALLTIL